MKTKLPSKPKKKTTTTISLDGLSQTTTKESECPEFLCVIGFLAILGAIGSAIFFGGSYLLNVHPESGKCYRNSEESNVFAKVDYVQANGEVHYYTSDAYISVEDDRRRERSISSFQERYDKEVDCINYDAPVFKRDIERLSMKVYELEYREEARREQNKSRK